VGHGKIDGHLAHGLGGVGMKERAPGLAQGGDVSDGKMVPVSLVANMTETMAVLSSAEPQAVKMSSSAGSRGYGQWRPWRP